MAAVPTSHLAVHFPPSDITALNPQRSFRISASRFRCSAGQTGFFKRLGRLIKEKAKSDVEKIFSGFSKTRENLAVIDELLLYWNLADTDRVLDELEEALLVSDFGPRISMKIVDGLRDDIMAGKLKSGSEIKVVAFVLFFRLLVLMKIWLGLGSVEGKHSEAFDRKKL